MTRTTIEVAEVASPIGDVEIAFRAGRMCALAFAHGEVRLEHVIARRFGNTDCRPAARTPAAASKLRRYFEGDLRALQTIPVDLDGTPFQLEVWTALRAISPGQAASYQEVARAIGRPNAVRAVGTATGINPIGLVIPCHRVIRADGALGGYGGGIERKRWLLQHEQSQGSSNQN